MKQRFYTALGLYAVLATFAGFTLDGNMRLATLVFLGGLAVKTAIRYFGER